MTKKLDNKEDPSPAVPAIADSRHFTERLAGLVAAAATNEWHTIERMSFPSATNAMDRDGVPAMGEEDTIRFRERLKTLGCEIKPASDFYGWEVRKTPLLHAMTAYEVAGIAQREGRPPLAVATENINKRMGVNDWAGLVDGAATNEWQVMQAMTFAFPELPNGGLGIPRFFTETAISALLEIRLKLLGCEIKKDVEGWHVRKKKQTGE